MADPARCTAHTTAGRPCCKPHHRGDRLRHPRRFRPPGSSRCCRRTAGLEAITAAERMPAAAGVDAAPIEHLIDKLLRTSALMLVYGQMVAALDDAAARDLQRQHADTRGERGYAGADERSHDELRVVAKDWLLGFDRHGAATLHPFVVEYHRLIELRAKLAKMGDRRRLGRTQGPAR